MIEHSQIAEIFVQVRLYFRIFSLKSRPILFRKKKNFISVELKWSLMILFTLTLQATLDHFLISGVQSLALAEAFDHLHLYRTCIKMKKKAIVIFIFFFTAAETCKNNNSEWVWKVSIYIFPKAKRIQLSTNLFI